MTYNELMKALELCPTDEDNCNQCPLHYTETSGECLVHICTSALDLIKRQQDHLRQVKCEVEEAKKEIAKEIFEKIYRKLGFFIKHRDVNDTIANMLYFIEQVEKEYTEGDVNGGEQ